MVDKQEFLELREAAVQAAIQNVKEYGLKSDRLRGFDNLTPEETFAVIGDSVAYKLLEARGQLEQFVRELVEKYLPVSLAANLQQQEKPKAIITAGSLGVNEILFERNVQRLEAQPFTKGQYFVKDFGPFYNEVYRKLEEFEVGNYRAENRPVTFPGVRDFSGVIEAVKDVVGKLGCSFIAGDNLDAHPVRDPLTAITCRNILAELAQTHQIEILAFALSPEVAIERAAGTRFANDPEKVKKSMIGFAAYFSELVEVASDIKLVDGDGYLIFRKEEHPKVAHFVNEDGEVPKVIPGEEFVTTVTFVDEKRFTKWLESCGVEIPKDLRRIIAECPNTVSAVDTAQELIRQQEEHGNRILAERHATVAEILAAPGR